MKFYYVHDYEFDWEVFPNAFDIINYTDEMNQTLDSKKSKVETHWNSENTSWKVSQLIDKNVNIQKKFQHRYLLLLFDFYQHSMVLLQCFATCSLISPFPFSRRACTEATRSRTAGFDLGD